MRTFSQFYLKLQKPGLGDKSRHGRLVDGRKFSSKEGSGQVLDIARIRTFCHRQRPKEKADVETVRENLNRGQRHLGVMTGRELEAPNLGCSGYQHKRGNQFQNYRN